MLSDISPFYRSFSRWTWISQYQNVFILDFIRAKMKAAVTKTCKAPVKCSPPTNQHTHFLQARCPSCRATNSVRALKENESSF